MSALTQELNLKLGIKVHVDASAALGVAQRRKLGKLGHLQTGSLWMQEQELKNRMKLNDIHGSLNISDMLTKNDGREIFERHVGGCSAQFMGGGACATKAVNLHLTQREI